jgi:hypothetical protein
MADPAIGCGLFGAGSQPRERKPAYRHEGQHGWQVRKVNHSGDRGVNEIRMASCDGVTGFPKEIHKVCTK